MIREWIYVRHVFNHLDFFRIFVWFRILSFAAIMKDCDILLFIF